MHKLHKDLTGWKGQAGNPLTRAVKTKKELTKAQIKADKEAAQISVSNSNSLRELTMAWAFVHQ